jgi:hypothetical protein
MNQSGDGLAWTEKDIGRLENQVLATSKRRYPTIRNYAIIQRMDIRRQSTVVKMAEST